MFSKKETVKRYFVYIFVYVQLHQHKQIFTIVGFDLMEAHRSHLTHKFEIVIAAMSWRASITTECFKVMLKILGAPFCLIKCGTQTLYLEATKTEWKSNEARATFL